MGEEERDGSCGHSGEQVMQWREVLCDEAGGLDVLLLMCLYGICSLSIPLVASERASDCMVAIFWGRLGYLGRYLCVCVCVGVCVGVYSCLIVYC